ncbi:MAG TPA: type II toxin-antitoxin system VapB family antitoxin [Xanthomonadales bacterium]|nr:type II toxin-antitoxin system VapB family antitoxin [Xanthomonadales bacterium]
MIKARIFKNNQSQAVRLPKAAALPDDVESVDVVIIGRSRLISPAGESWDCWFDGENVSSDFMPQREQPGEQVRSDTFE